MPPPLINGPSGGPADRNRLLFKTPTYYEFLVWCISLTIGHERVIWWQADLVVFFSELWQGAHTLLCWHNPPSSSPHAHMRITKRFPKLWMEFAKSMRQGWNRRIPHSTTSPTIMLDSYYMTMISNVCEFFVESCCLGSALFVFVWFGKLLRGLRFG